MWEGGSKDERRKEGWKDGKVEVGKNNRRE